jgi:hypothetical protein
VRDILKAATRAGAPSAGETLRGLEVLLAASVVAWH